MRLLRMPGLLRLQNKLLWTFPSVQHLHRRLKLSYVLLREELKLLVPSSITQNEDQTYDPLESL